jgi:beta-lactamase regulating signal transducer with metallopeptidase domain
MNEIIKLILSLSLSGTILALLIFIIKPLIKYKLSKVIQYYLWIVVLLRLIVPFSFENSIMNKMFYKNETSLARSHNTVQSIGKTSDNIVNSSMIEKVEENKANKVYNSKSNDSNYYQGALNKDNVKDLFNKYALYLWILGVAVVFITNLIGFARFSKQLKRTNKTITEKEKIVLNSLLNKRDNVTLVRNPYVATPILLGILRPYIIIPDIDFSENQLRNILLHEISHLRRFDIGVKWLTMISTSIHWFNPIMYVIKKEINRACELACDETVIKNLSPAEKQAYGDTLIAVVAEHKYSGGALQATMCEEKKTLKERLVAIMKHNKKPRFIIVLSVILLGLLIFGGLYLGGGVKKLQETPPNLYINMENESTKTALMGSYGWSYRGTNISVDSDHPVKFQYKFDNIVSVTAKQQFIVSTQKLNLDKKYNFTLEEISVYKDGQLVGVDSVEPSIMNGDLYLQAPPNSGEHIYVLALSFKDRGTVTYGFIVRVDMATYNLDEIAKYKTLYVGDNSKVPAIVDHLPVPDSYFKQQYISMGTDNRPYKLNVFYEGKKSVSHISEWPITSPNTATYSNLQKNALVLFSMIDNVDEITFLFRDSQSEGTLDESKYDTAFTFSRDSIQEKYGDLSLMGKDLKLLQEALEVKK